MQNFYPPRIGENILLVCLDCKFAFHGPNPGPRILHLFSKTKCPRCKSRKVAPHPGIHY